ncbi:MAG: hypothetical protein OEZ11_04700 [Gammaproteobacteria bacterium]|nr:hypothetical protein [Gammaproteobacteria bacterium]
MKSARNRSGAGLRNAIAGLTLALISCSAAVAQVGPINPTGYLEYRYLYQAGTGREATGANGLALRTDLSTYIWRPWLLSVKGSLMVQDFRGSTESGPATSSIAQGGIWLNFLARSQYPLTIYYEDFDADYDSQPYQRTARTRSHGFRQQLTSKRYGTYSLEWRNGETDSLYLDGISLPTRNMNDKWEFKGRQSFGRNNFSLLSRKLLIDAREPDIRTDSLRHAMRHWFRAGPRFNLQNTYFVTDEEVSSDFVQSDRIYQQLFSLATWRPDAANRWFLTGRGLFQDNESSNQATGSGQSNVSLSGTASYRLTDRVSLTGALGVSRTKNADMAAASDTGYQHLGVAYASIGYPLWGGIYQFSGRGSIENRTENGALTGGERQELKSDVGHSLGRSFETDGGNRIDIRGIQRLTTSHDSFGATLNVLRSSVYATSGVAEEQLSRYLRLSVTDQRSFGDERRSFQLLDLQYSLQGTLGRDRSWNLDASAQYGLRSQDEPESMQSESRSLAYSVSVAYRHANLFDVSFLNYTSDLQFRSDDFQSEDPFDPDFDIDRKQISSSWINRLDYRIGLLQFQSDLNLNEVDGHWFASFRLTVRRYFGMR